MKATNVIRAALCLMFFISGCASTQKVDNSETTPKAVPAPTSNYKVTCLESKPGDSKLLGENIAVSNNYVAISDLRANRVVIYTKNNDGEWQRNREIYPPPDSVAHKLGRGFGWGLAINNDILLIKSVGKRRRFEDKGTQPLAELYTVSLSSEEASPTFTKINYPQPDQTSISSLTFLEQNIAFAARTIDENNKRVNRIYIADPISGAIVNAIESPEIQYPEQKINKYDRFRAELEIHKNALVLGYQPRKWYESIFRLTPDEKLEKIQFDRKQVDGKQPSPAHYRLTNYSLLSFVTSDNLSAIGRNLAGGQNTLIFTGFPEISQFKIIESSGALDAYKSQVLISHRTAPGAMPIYQGQPDHTLVGLEDNEIVVKSDIFWERGSHLDPRYSEEPFILTFGALGEQGLFLAARGKVVYLPLKNLPEQYEIKLLTCGE